MSFKIDAELIFVEADTREVFLAVDDNVRDAAREIDRNSIRKIVYVIARSLCAYDADKVALVIKETAARVALVDRGACTHNAEIESGFSVRSEKREILHINVDRALCQGDSVALGVTYRKNLVAYANLVGIGDDSRERVTVLDNIASADLENGDVVCE